MSWPGCSASGPCCPYPEMEQYTTEGFTRRTLSSSKPRPRTTRSEEHTSELQSPCNLVCRLLLEKKKIQIDHLDICQAQANVVTIQADQDFNFAYILVTARDCFTQRILHLWRCPHDYF